MKTITFLLVAAAIWACNDTNTAPPKTGNTQQEPQKAPSESHPRQFSP